MKQIAIALILGFGLFAQQPHSVTLTWTDTQNPTGTTYTVYRADWQCSGCYHK